MLLFARLSWAETPALTGLGFRTRRRSGGLFFADKARTFLSPSTLADNLLHHSSTFRNALPHSEHYNDKDYGSH